MKTLLMCAVMAMALSACGVKPGNVSAPEGVKDTYPAAYPALHTDDMGTWTAPHQPE